MSTYSQMLKGILEGCLLSIIGEGSVYGYELSKKLEYHGMRFVGEGSIYPLLLRMQKEKWIIGDVTYGSLSQGPPRKYYRLTELGEEILQQFKSNWTALKKSVDHILAEEENHED